MSDASHAAQVIFGGTHSTKHNKAVNFIAKSISIMDFCCDYKRTWSLFFLEKSVVMILYILYLSLLEQQQHSRTEKKIVFFQFF